MLFEENLKVLTKIISAPGNMYNVINRVKTGVIFSQTCGLFLRPQESGSPCW